MCRLLCLLSKTSIYFTRVRPGLLFVAEKIIFYGKKTQILGSGYKMRCNFNKYNPFFEGSFQTLEVPLEGLKE